MLIMFHQQSGKLLFAGYAMARERPKASLVQREVARRSRDGGIVADQSYHYAGIYANLKLFPHNPSVSFAANRLRAVRSRL